MAWLSSLEPQNGSSGVSMQGSGAQTSEVLYPWPRDWAGMCFWLKEQKEAKGTGSLKEDWLEMSWG